MIKYARSKKWKKSNFLLCLVHAVSKRFKTVASGSSRPSEGLKWVKAVETAESSEELSTDGPGWEQYSMKISEALSKSLSGGFQKRVILTEEQLQGKGEMLNGRQLDPMVARHMFDGTLMAEADVQSLGTLFSFQHTLQKSSNH